jgi:GNAT superfamily N-acetyltransferase
MEVVDLTEEYMRYVALCTHMDDPDEEKDRAANERESWIKVNLKNGLKFKIALKEGKPMGFAHCLPIELGTWGMSGQDLMTIPCLTLGYERVYKGDKGSGVGRALVEAVEEEAKKEMKGVAVLAYDNEFWFMPYSFFKKLGYSEVAREDDQVIMLKAFEPVTPPVFRKLNYQSEPIPGKVVIDAFWNPICLTSILEIHHVREVSAEYKDKVILNEYNSGNKDILERYGASRALFIDGEPKNWGYAAPKDELRKEIDEALQRIN